MSRTAKIGWMAIGALITFVIPQGGANVRSADQPADAMLKRLLRERIMLNQEIVSNLKKLSGPKGVVSKVEVLNAERGLLGAEFDAAETKDQRVSALTKIVDLEKRIAEIKAQTNTSSQIERIQDQIRSIDAEISLEKEKLRTKPID